MGWYEGYELKLWVGKGYGLRLWVDMKGMS